MPRKSYRRQYRRLYKNYKGDTSTTLTKREVRAAAEIAGFSPSEAKQMMQISLGESGRRPGAVGDDAAAGYGNTFGLGLVRTTPLAWGKGTAAWNHMEKLGGERAMFNPIKQMKMAKFLYDSAGETFSPWYGTRYLKDRDPGAKSVLGRGEPNRHARGSQSVTIPGVDNSALRQSYLQGYLQNRGDPSALLELAQGLEGAQDIPGTVVPGETTLRGRDGRVRDVRTASGQSVNKMLSKAVKWDKAKAPYLWGGGHGAIAKPGDPVDCSGFVSAVLGLDTPQVSGNLMNWGKPGKGRWVTVYSNDGHVLMSIRDPKTKKVRWFGTSRSNPGGGAGEIAPPDAGYLSRFVARRPA